MKSQGDMALQTEVFQRLCCFNVLSTFSLYWAEKIHHKFSDVLVANWLKEEV